MLKVESYTSVAYRQRILDPCPSPNGWLLVPPMLEEFYNIFNLPFPMGILSILPVIVTGASFQTNSQGRLAAGKWTGSLVPFTPGEVLNPTGHRSTDNTWYVQGSFRFLDENNTPNTPNNTILPLLVTGVPFANLQL